jgi:hypothetical protein
VIVIASRLEPGLRLAREQSMASDAIALPEWCGLQNSDQM